jgi:transcriptional/translational regulatory protein YebC/TACO1
VSLDEAQRSEVEAVFGALDEDDDVQNLYVALG